MKRVIVLLFTLCLPCWGSFTAVNSAHGTGDTASNTIATAAASATAGNHIVVGITWADTTSTVNKVQDTAGNTYTEADATCLKHSATATQSTDIWLATNITGNASNVVTATFQTGQTPTFRRISIEQYSTTNSGSITFDHCGTGDGNGGSMTLSTFNTSQASEVDFAFYSTGNNGNPWTAGTNYTLRQTGTSGDSQTEDWIMSATQTGVAAPITATSPGTWVGSHGAFKEPASGGSPSGFDKAKKLDQLETMLREQKP
ncbi:MAG TPA: hypothetical protein VFA71_03925 [Terriglobales bacterium]|nr:hypothetical protein [Terriglobales bacterium]